MRASHINATSADSGSRRRHSRQSIAETKARAGRVCCACEVQKPCHRCKVKKPMTEYTASAWKARHIERRICKACMNKGSWTCATCHLSLAHMAFSAWLRHRPSGRDGTQICDECYRARKLTRITAKARERLQKRRTTLRRREILQEVRAEVESMVRGRSAQPQQHKSSSPHQTQQQPVTDMREKEPKPNMTQLRPGLAGTRGPPSANDRKRKSPSDGSVTRSNETSADAAEEIRCIPKPPRVKDKRYIAQHSDNPRAAPATTSVKYQCPYCQASAESTIKNGTVHVAGHCGKQFASAMDGSLAGTRTLAPSAARRSNLRASVAKSNAATRSPTAKLAQPSGGG